MPRTNTNTQYTYSSTVPKVLVLLSIIHAYHDGCERQQSQVNQVDLARALSLLPNQPVLLAVQQAQARDGDWHVLSAGQGEVQHSLALGIRHLACALSIRRLRGALNPMAESELLGGSGGGCGGFVVHIHHGVRHPFNGSCHGREVHEDGLAALRTLGVRMVDMGIQLLY